VDHVPQNHQISADAATHPATLGSGAQRPVSLARVDGVTAMESRENRRAIPVRCLAHAGSEGLSVLRVERHGEQIVLAPHVSGACVIVLDEAAAATLFDVLGTWLG
jgi:hypothetical protein